MKNTFYLIPSILGPGGSIKTISPEIIEAINGLDVILCEKPKATRAFLKSLKIKKPIREFEFFELNLHTKREELEQYLQMILKGKRVGIIPEAGCPGIADPGSDLVSLAHQNGIIVKPLAGPCSIILALMGSGLNGQNFAFNGYLPKEKKPRIRKIIELEKLSFRTKQTQIFMETPYRAQHVFEDLLDNLKDDTVLSVAIDLTLPYELILSKEVYDFRKFKKDLNLKGRYVVFLIQRN